MPSFHPMDEQIAFEPAEDAYNHYLEVRDQCVSDYQNMEDEEDDDDQ